ncbi:major facilitator superfamily domain-containing protein [Crassisporium funariophilum]|nr:major facilitator superfamily domain-containing protein [Crassisporium funariophilum]
MSEHNSFSDSDVKDTDISKDSSINEKIEKTHSYHDVDFERRTMRYVDWRILPVLALVYSFALIDRINLGAAHTAGMGVDLKLLTGDRFSVVSCVYFVPYILLQLPGNLVLRKFGVRNWLTFIVASWGAVQLGMGFVKTWGYLALCRVLLGIFEASFFPALLFIISTWYKRHEVHTRLAVFYLLSVTAGGLSPILAYVFSLLGGKQGIAGWRWIFIIEGAITLALATVTWLFIPAFPDQNTFLTHEQTALVLKRIDEDRGDAVPDALTLKKVVGHLCDWTLWAYGIMFMCAAMPSYAQSFFLPIILRGMGWSQTASLLLSAPPYGPSILTTLLVAWLSDKHKHRSGFIVLTTLVCLIGLCLTAFAKQNEVRYFGAFLINAGNSGAIPTILAYSSNNVVSHSKRSVQTAMTISLGAIGGILATTVFRAKDYPRYIPGLAVTIGSQILMLLLLALTTIHFTRLNRLMREGKRTKPLEGQPGFLYTL